MPLVLKKNIDYNTQIAIWQHTESFDFFKEKVYRHLTQHEKNKLVSYKALTRQKEWLATRYLLFHVLIEPAEIQYTQANKPFLTNKYLGISHSKNYVAIIVSNAHNVALDIEENPERVLAIVPKFLNNDEKIFLKKSVENATTACIMWCAKETVYKLYGLKNVDFASEIVLSHFQLSNHFKIDAQLKKNGTQNIKLQAERHNDFIVTYAIEK